VLLSTQITLTEGVTNVESWAAAVDGTPVIIGERLPPRTEVCRDLSFTARAKRSIACSEHQCVTKRRFRTT
jgi:hypothetical protein